MSQGSARPYQYRGTAYRWVGNTTVVMSADEYNRMKRRGQTLSLDPRRCSRGKEFETEDPESIQRCVAVSYRS